MRLAGRAEVVLDAQVQLEPAGPEPHAAPAGEVRGLRHLGHPEDVAVEPAQHVLGAARRGELDVVQPHQARLVGHAAPPPTCATTKTRRNGRTVPHGRCG